MAPGDDQQKDLVLFAREVRNQEHLQADPAVLEEIKTFLLSKECDSARSATHTVLENYPDWWTRGRRAPPGLEIESQEDLEQLYRHAGTLFGLGIPLTFAERRTTAFRLFQDIEAWGTRDEALPSEELVGPDAELTRLLGAMIGEVFPGHPGFLDAAVYDATGLSQTRGVKKTSLRLVWPGLVVDADRAARLRDLLVHRLTNAAAEDGAIKGLEGRLKALSPANAWYSVFGDAAYAGRSAVRMPLSDRVAPLPLRAPERRPLVPVGVLRFSFGGEGKLKVEWLCRGPELEGQEWIKIGCLRQSADAQLTEWSVPSWPGNQPIPPSSTRTGRVKVRTAGGSDGGGGLRLKANTRAAPPERAGQLLTVERRFNGAADQFCDKMEQHLGKAVVEPDGAHVWKQPGGEARIIMYPEDKRVKVVGRPNQVRSLVVIVAPYTEAKLGLDADGNQQEFQQDHQQGGLLPSAAFAPQGVDDSSDPHAAEPGDSSSGLGTPTGQQFRRATQDFQSEGQGELSLKQDDVIYVTHDPEGDQGGGADRWVYGKIEKTGACGWFPMSHSVPWDETTQ